RRLNDHLEQRARARELERQLPGLLARTEGGGRPDAERFEPGDLLDGRLPPVRVEKLKDAGGRASERQRRRKRASIGQRLGRGCAAQSSATNRSSLVKVSAARRSSSETSGWPARTRKSSDAPASAAARRAAAGARSRSSRALAGSSATDTLVPAISAASVAG